MKKLLACIFIAFSCASEAQSFNAQSTKDNNTQLIGKFNEQGLERSPFDSWFFKNRDAYTPKSETISKLRSQLPEYTISLFMGTWCGDSKREVPRFYKILKDAEFPLDRLTSIAVSREKETYKQSPGGEEEGLDIHRVPTIILYRDGEEINRIVERPRVSLEEDLVKIIEGDYQSNYNGVAYLANQLKEQEAPEKLRHQRRILKDLQSRISNFSELNTFSYVLNAAGRKKTASFVAEINLKLFPNEPFAYLTLGAMLQESGQLNEAKTCYDKALILDPENERLQKMIAERLQIQQN